MTKVIKVITDNVEGWKLYKTPTKFLLSYNRNSNQYSIPDTIIKIKPSTRVYSYNLINSISFNSAYSNDRLSKIISILYVVLFIIFYFGYNY